MIKINVIASGSKGNCYLIEKDNSSLLIDPGISFKQIIKKTSGKVYTVDGCLISHSHQDHCISAKDCEKFRKKIKSLHQVKKIN